VNVDKGTWFCFHCAWSGGLGGEFHKGICIPSEPPRPDDRKREALKQVWADSLTATHHDAQLLKEYLKNRGLSEIGELPKTIRFHPSLNYWHEGKTLGRYPAMLCRVDNPEGKPVSIHRTYLKDGNKAPVPEPKKLMSPPVSGATRGAAIRLFQATDTLAVAEGVETALAVYIATNMPVWATISAGGMASLRLPESVTTVRIMTDLDRSGAGELAARSLAMRLVREGRDARIIKPRGPVPADRKGIDWLDVLQGLAA
jgi:putative DNA primase/helicase